MKSNTNAKWQSLGRDTQGVFKLYSLRQGCKCEHREDTHKDSGYITKSVFLSLCCYCSSRSAKKEEEEVTVPLHLLPQEELVLWPRPCDISCCTCCNPHSHILTYWHCIGFEMLLRGKSKLHTQPIEKEALTKLTTETPSIFMFTENINEALWLCLSLYVFRRFFSVLTTATRSSGGKNSRSQRK